MNTPQISQTLFWDIPEKDIDKTLHDAKDWVVIRVFEYGTVEEINEIINYYGDSSVMKILKSARYLKPVTKAMARLFLDLNIK